MASSVEKKSGRFVVLQQYWEAFYPEEFSDLYPNSKEQPLVPKSWDPNISLPILHLSHITHNEQASSIKQNDFFFCFVPRQKLGKSPVVKYDGTPLGITFKKVGSDEYIEVPCKSPVLPGYFSWWGISCRECYARDPAGRKFREAVDRIKASNYNVYEAGYLKNLPSSKYGNREFIFSLGNLIESYKRSRVDCWNKDVYLKKAGTLHYRYEVCYVVMVVMWKDMEDDSSILAMPSMFGEPCFENNGCIDSNGKLLNDCLPSFKVKRPFTRFEGEFLSWESLVFAFYFARSDQLLWCPKECGIEREVGHFNCISKQGTEWVCPNVLQSVPEMIDF